MILIPMCWLHWLIDPAVVKRETPTHCFDWYYAPPLSMCSNMLVQAPPVSCSSLRISLIPSRPRWACLAGVPRLLHTTLFTALHQRAVTCRDLTVFLTSSWSILVLGRSKTSPSERGQWTHRHRPYAVTNDSSCDFQLITSSLRYPLLFCY